MNFWLVQSFLGALAWPLTQPVKAASHVTESTCCLRN